MIVELLKKLNSQDDLLTLSLSWQLSVFQTFPILEVQQQSVVNTNQTALIN